MDYDNLLDLVKKTRSLRRFKPDPIPDEYIEKMIEVARWAPSGFNQQPWEFVVVKDSELRSKIAQYSGLFRSQSHDMETTREAWQGKGPSMMRSNEANYSIAPVYIIVFGDTRTRDGLPMKVRYDIRLRDRIFTSGLVNAFLYLHMAASSLGLASQWVSWISEPYVECMVKDLLGIPKEMEVYDMLAVGYPAVKARPKLLRPKEKMVHFDRCSAESFRTDDEVKDFIRRSRNWILATMARGPDHFRGM